MASMFSNVFGYLRPKPTLPVTTAPINNHPVPETCHAEGDKCPEDDIAVVYDIEDQDDWQVVRKLKEAVAPPNNSAEGSDEELEVDDEDDASSTRRAALYRSAPPVIMEKTLRPLVAPPSPDKAAVAQIARRPRTPSRTKEPPMVPAAPVIPTVRSYKRKRRLRPAAQRDAAAVATNSPTTANAAAAATETTRRELGVCSVDEADKQGQHEDKERRTSKKALAKNQLQRLNYLAEANVPRKCGNRDGTYRSLH